MKVLLTSGGTKVPIDKVRDITNMSSGTFGSKIGRELIDDKDVELIFFGAKNSKMPFSINVDFKEMDGNHDVMDEFHSLYSFFLNCKARYRQETYKTYQEYAVGLKKLLVQEQPEVVVLAAAVSDYIVPNPTDGKARSSDDLSIELVKAAKLIGKVKEWSPNSKLVGFKLLVDSSDEELIEAARKSIVDNGCDLIVANDLRDIKAGKHKLLIVTKNDVEEHYSFDKDPNYLARIVARKAVEL